MLRGHSFLHSSTLRHIGSAGSEYRIAWIFGRSPAGESTVVQSVNSQVGAAANSSTGCQTDHARLQRIEALYFRSKAQFFPFQRASAAFFARNLRCAGVSAFVAASDAFFARRFRPAAPRFSAAFFPPILPPRLPILRKYSDTSGGTRAINATNSTISRPGKQVRIVRAACLLTLLPYAF
jgi:hypothetical protein